MFIRIGIGDYLNLNNISRIKLAETNDAIKVLVYGSDGKLFYTNIFLKDKSNDMVLFNELMYNIKQVLIKSEYIPEENNMSIDSIEIEYKDGFIKKKDDKYYYIDKNGNEISITEEQFALYYNIALSKEEKDE